MKDRTTRWLLRLYPAPWRRRHGEELADWLAARPLTPGLALDLIRGALDARWRGGRSASASRLAFLGWWIGAHLLLGAVALLAIRTMTGVPAELLATVLAALLTGSVGQWLVLRCFLVGVGRWVPATMAGAIGGLALVTVFQKTLPYVGGLADDVVCFGVLVLCIGIGQWLALGRGRPGAGWWPLASALGGVALVPTYMAALAATRPFFQALRTIAPPGALLRVSAFSPEILLPQGAVMGAIYALVTGAVLLRLARRPVSGQESPDRNAVGT